MESIDYPLVSNLSIDEARSTLRSDAKKIASYPDFSLRNQAMARLVGPVSVNIVSTELGGLSEEKYGQLTDLFVSLAIKCGNEFRGVSITEKDKYDEAKSSVSKHVLENVGSALKILGNDTDIRALIPKVNIFDEMEIVAEDLGVTQVDLDAKTLDEQILNTTKEDNPFYVAMKNQNAVKSNSFSAKEKQAIRVVAALSQLGYIQTQLPRELEEKSGRFDRDQFDTNIGMKTTLYKHGGLPIAGFETLKDIIILQERLSSERH